MRPDNFKRAYIYSFRLPKQLVREFRANTRQEEWVNGTEFHSIHPCLVISNNVFNDNQGEGLVVVPLTTGQLKNNKPKPTWVRVRLDDGWALVLCEQVRFIDKRRCANEKDSNSRLSKYDWGKVREVLTKLLFPLPPPIEDMEDLIVTDSQI